MAVENGRNGGKDMDDASTSKSHEGEEKSSGGRGDQQKPGKSKGDEETETVPFIKLFSFADSTDILLMILGTIGAVGNGASIPIMSILFGDLTNSFGQNQNSKEVVDVVSKVSLKFVYLGLGSAVAAFLQVACWMVTGERQAARIRGTYLNTILKQDIAFFDKETNTGEVVGRMSGDTVLIQDAMGEKVGKFIQLVSTFIGGFIIAFIKGWLLTLVMLSSIPPLVIAGAGLAIVIARMASRGQTAYAKAAIVVEQTIGSIRTVASFTGERQALSNYNKFLATAYKSGVQEGFTSGLGLGIVMLLVFCSYALAVWFGGKMILEKGYSGGDVLNVIVAVLMGSMSLGQASPCLSSFAAGQAAAYKMFETINRKPEIDSSDTRGKILDDIGGDVELRDVYFTYPARPDEQIFAGFSLFIPSGTTAALVGQSGSGKSTVISLIERFYDPQAGEVLIDGTNIKEFQLKWIREKIGLVSQEPVLFASSIKDNIAYGKDSATTEEIKAAAELANAAKFIDKLPQGIDTMVGEHGTQLSGGQKQRIAIARAILKDPRILLLDEATSALDTESERIVQEALDRIMVNRTTVIVAHRLSTVRNADMIAVIYRGKMVEKGSHSELLKDPEGAYSQLIRLQEVNKESKLETEDPKKSDISAESLRRSSQRISLKRSISRGSSGAGHSNRHSFSVSFGLPAGCNVTDKPTSELEASPQKQEAPDVPISRLAYLNKPEVPVLIAGCIFAILNGLIFPVYGILLSSIMKTFFEPPDELRKDSKFWSLIFMALGLASFVVYPSQTYLFSVAGCKLIQRIRSMCFEKVVHMEVSWFDEPDHSSGAIGARLSADAATVRALVGDSLSLLVQNISSAIAGLVRAMAVENGRNGGKDMDEASTSKSHEGEEKSSGGRGDQQKPGKSKGDEETKTVPFIKLFSFADSTDILLMILGTIGAVGNGASFPIMSIFFGDLTNSFGQNQNSKEVLVDLISKVSLQFVYLGLGSAVAAFLQVACWMVTGERQAARIRGTYLNTILKQDIAFFDKETNTGEVVGRMSGDTVLIQDAMGEKVGKFIQLVSTFIGGFIIAFIKGWLLTLVMLSSIPPLVIAGAGLAIVVARMASRGQTAYAKAAIVVEQTIGSIRTVASFTGERQALSNYKKFLATAYKSGVQEGFTSGFGLGIVMLLVFCSYALAVWFGGKMILEKGYSGGDVLNVIFAVLMGSMSLGQASPCLSSFAAGQAAAYKMFETINRKPEIDSSDTRGKILDDIGGDVELRDVYFTYPARPDEQIFAGFSLFIPSGTTAALVGQSGSGKSTVISLIERFYDPQAGEVLIDGTNLKEFQLKWIREKIGLVSQEPVLFASSIKDNIAYGKDRATTEEIKAAAELANAAKFIDKLPQGIDTMVGEHGTQVSGGQKQRIAIARAMLKDPRILLLDEATSALDTESERIVQEALDRIMVNRTTVIVAHRLSTVRNADMIAVIYRGKMVEKGSHSELLKDPEGAYSQLIRLQEINKESKLETEDPKKSDISSESRSSQRISLKRSISRGSSSVGQSSRHSFSVSFGLPAGSNVTDKPTSELEASPQKQEAPDVPISRLAYLNKPEVPVLIAGCIVAILNGLMFPVYSILLSSVMKTFYETPDELRKDSKFWSLIFMAVGLASFVVYPSQTYLFSVAGCKLIQRIRSMCFEKVVHMEVSWFDEPEHSSGEIGARLSADAATVRALVGDSLSLLVQNISSAIAGLVIAFTACWQLAFVVLVLVPLLGLNGFLQVKFMKGFSADAKKMYEEASQVANDAVGSIRTVASFCAEEKVMHLYRRKCEGPMRTGIRQGMISGTGFGVSFFLLYSVYATCFYVGAQLVQHGKATFPEVFRVGMGISQSSSFASDFSKAKGAAASIFAIIDRKSKIDPSDESGTTLHNVKGEIELRHISFKYPSRPDIEIFRDLSLAIHSGKAVALVGESGSGKSTVISLLQRFYDPDSGHITLDGIDIQSLQLKWLRHQMGLVSQEPVLFNETIRANIAYGKEGNATEAEILAASELANAHKFISSLQQGYDTVVGERGTHLSGGQKQRVAIARAMVKSPKILLLDEATSALDAESERVVQDALDRVMVSRTTVVVAHRLSTIKNADVIAVVKNGVIVEEGKHETLIHIKDGFYASLNIYCNFWYTNVKNRKGSTAVVIDISNIAT
ncbi:hypothetical protein SADUNF_Sadunf14G0083100 [Salix dunnii]|uniref:Uncharacterized protein n=1 Tax=Salix dunnii TaxID=1413687 RepID=A0A835MKL2_9ROSI|nr:hypothetical protein SADUNF_Sadunf14G0083100 [Salix dunnii]